MSELAQSIKKDDVQLPTLTPRKNNQSIPDGIQSSDNQDHVFPLTHAHKSKKHRRKFRKHSPEYYEQKRLQKINKTLEKRWDSHFINDHIPDIIDKNSKPAKKLSKQINPKRSFTPMNPKIAQRYNKTGNFIQKKEDAPLPRIQTSDKRSRSFNVHVVPQKPIVQNAKTQKVLEAVNQVKRESKPQLKPASEEQKTRKKTSKKSRSHIEPQILKEKHKQYFEAYTKTLNQLHEEMKFSNCHKDALELFLQGIDRKNIRDLIDKQFSLIRQKQSLAFKVVNAIGNREKFLAKINQAGLKLIQKDKETLQLIDHYRTSTLAVVEEILKWKETWHSLYYKAFKKSKNFDFIHQAKDYLLTLSQSTDQVLQKIKKENQNKSEAKEEKTEIIEEASPLKQHKTQQQLNTNQFNQNTKKPQTQKSLYIATSNDPFLICLHGIGKEEKNIILKIRACELLLIESKFNFHKE